MATVNFLYRSQKEKSNLNLRLLFSHNGRNFQIGGKTKLIVSKDYWKNIHHKKRINEPDLSNYRNEINEKLTKLSNFILKEFNQSNPDEVDKEWLSDTIERYYNPKPEIPSRLIHFFDYYLKEKSIQLTETRIRRINVIRNFLIKLEDYTGKTYEINKVNNKFLSDLIKYSNLNGYAVNTQKGYLSVIKTICYYARDEKNIQISNLKNISIKEEKSLTVYLNFEEIEKIRNHQFETDYLDNARDWLIISCYTGQRVSDFMRFTTDMIIKEDHRVYLKFKQKKTGKAMKIPFIEEARSVLEKRGGQFPRKISSQKYNDYIKEVCKQVGINEMVKGKMRVCIIDDPSKATKNDYRDVEGLYPKWQLVSSHIGRRSFATNYYGKKKTANLIYITGHKTERMFKAYVKADDDEQAKRAFDDFE